MKDIEEYEGKYAIAEDGRVWSYANEKHGGKYLNPPHDKDGYVRVTLSKRSCKRSFHVHRLVAKGFIPNSFNLPQVNHKNGIKTDNRVENLEWCTDAENKKHSALNGLHPFGERQHWAKLSDEKVREILELHNKFGEDFNFSKVGKMFGVDRNAIRGVVRNKTWRHVERELPQLGE